MYSWKSCIIFIDVKSIYIYYHIKCLDVIRENLDIFCSKNILVRIMKKLFLVDGAAGYVKEDLLKYINSKENFYVVKKYTTRKNRDKKLKHNTDLIYISNDKFLELESKCYCYNYGEEKDGYGIARYGIPKNAIQNAVKEFENVFVIVRSSKRINDIIKDYGNKVKVVTVLIYPDKQYTYDRIKKDKNLDYIQKKCEIQARPKRINEVLKDYFIEFNFFNRIILLNDASEEHLCMQLNQLVAYCDEEPYDMLFVYPNQSYQLVKPIIGYKQDIIKKINEHPFEKNIFLMMKYRDDDRDGNYTNTDIFDLIYQTINEKGFTCVRADQNEWTHLADESVYNPLVIAYCCKYGIALIDKPEIGETYNSNVIYELGIMAAQNKSCLLRDETVENVPFDLITTIHRTYNPDNFKIEITEHLNSWLDNLNK